MAGTCAHCGRSLRPEDIYCRKCGTRRPDPAAGGPESVAPPPEARPEVFLAPPSAPPPPQPPPPPPRMAPPPPVVSARIRGGLAPGQKVTIAAVVVLAVGGLVGVLGFVSPGFFTASSTRAPSTTEPNSEPQNGFSTTTTMPTSPYSYDTTPTTETSTTTSDTTPDDEATAESLLRDEANRDRSSAESLVGSWVPQLSAKKPGMSADGVTYDYRKTWADFQSKRSQFPDALLLWSGDFASFRYGDYWITVVPRSYPDGPSANSWCDGQGIGKDDCYAKRLTHSGGYSGNTLLRQ